MSEKRVPYWEFMRPERKESEHTRTVRELNEIVSDMEKSIKERDEVIEKLREDIRSFEALLESKGIKRA